MILRTLLQKKTYNHNHLNKNIKQIYQRSTIKKKYISTRKNIILSLII